jgi:hypothetical protein
MIEVLGALSAPHLLENPSLDFSRRLQRFASHFELPPEDHELRSTAWGPPELSASLRLTLS